MDLQLFAEKSYAPSPHRLRRAREKGQVSSSADLTAALVFLAVSLLLSALMPMGVDRLGRAMRTLWLQTPPADLGTALPGLLRQWLPLLLLFSAPALLVAAAVGLGGGLLQTGFLFSLRPPDFARLSPAAGFGRLLSRRAAIDLGKRVLRLAVIAWTGYAWLRDALPQWPPLLAMPLPQGAAYLGGQTAGLLQRLALVLLLFGGADYALQRWQHLQDLRMTREEMRQEQREQETSPELRQQVRKKQRSLARRRMLQQVPKASVVITNPTHYAAALRYDPASMAAPRLIAKGQDLLALQIRRIAREAGVPVIENPPLARALHAQVPLDTEIPAELYQTVAAVLAYIYRTRR